MNSKIVIVLVSLWLASCSSGETSPDGGSPDAALADIGADAAMLDTAVVKPAKLEVLTAGPLAAEVGALFPSELKVKVLDDSGRALAGAAVLWSSDSGEGWFFPRRAISDASGVVETQWIAGPANSNESIVAQAEAAPAVRISLAAAIKAVPRSANSVHFQYAFAAATSFKIEIVPHSDPPSTYYAAMNWEGGYMGIQRKGDLYDRQVIFSVWDVNNIDAKVIDKGGARCDPFGGEGTGYKCRLSYAWKVGRTYRFEVMTSPATNATDLTAYFTDVAANKRIKIAKLRYGKSILLTYAIPFVEDYGPKSNSCLAAAYRSATSKNAEALVNGSWVKLHRGRFTHASKLTECANISAKAVGGMRISTGGDVVGDPADAMTFLSLP